jgi:Rrf2 family iron-sulfur cluster assembly transcriptional regulator
MGGDTVKLTRGTDYGIRGILYLAMRPFQQVTLLREIATSQDLPETYLAKIFQDLNKAGLVRSHRGAKGGFSLARPASEITLRQVIEGLQGPISLNRCLDVREVCPHEEHCAISLVLRQAQEQLLETLDAASFDALAEEELALYAQTAGKAAVDG